MARLDRFLKELASTSPTPGGGSAAALTAALGCSLGSMVSSILLSRPGIRLAERKILEANRKELAVFGKRLQRLIRQDAQAYEALVKAQRNGRNLARARTRSIACPLEICDQAIRAMTVLEQVRRRTGPYLGSDVKAALALLKGAFEAAYAMAEVNLQGSQDHQLARRLRDRGREWRRLADRSEKKV